MEFKAQPRTVRDALDLKRKYVIPRFQREYSWESEELSELWNDLLDNINISGNNLVASEYFIGSLVLVGDDDNTQSIERQVVDGQQRLMTFTIAFSVLAQLFKKEHEERLSDMIHNYIVGTDDDGNLFTKVVSETPKPFFQYRIQKKEIDFTQVPSTSEEKRILAAYKFFEQKLDKKNLIKELESRFPNIQMEYTNMLKLFRDQVLQCKVIYVTVKSFEDGYEIFEVLNAKGKNLAPIDIIKNKLFAILDQTEPIDMAYEKWGVIRDNISKGNIEEIMTFYRHFWLSKYSYATNKKLVNEFDKKIEKNQISYETFLNSLQEASADYAKIALPNSKDWTQPEDRKVFETLEAIDIFGVTQVRSFLLALFDVKRRKLIKHSEYIKILEYLQYFHFVFNAVCSERPSGLEQRYSSYARKLRSATTKQESAQYIRELMVALQSSLPSYEKFEMSFEEIKFTSKNTKNKKIVQYILKKVESYTQGAGEMIPISFSIEHIMPESTQNEEVGMLGNLLPLGVEGNSKLDTKPFVEKIVAYEVSQYQSTKKFADDYAEETKWEYEHIKKRTKDMARIMYTRNGLYDLN